MHTKIKSKIDRVVVKLDKVHMKSIKNWLARRFSRESK